MARRVAFLFALVAVACQTPTSNEIAGTYVAKYPFGEEFLTIEPNGVYTQSITIDGDHARLTTQGTWTYVPKDTEITLRNHMMAHDGYGGLNPKLKDPGNHWNAVLSVRKDLANHVLIVASADGSRFDYHKVD